MSRISHAAVLVVMFLCCLAVEAQTTRPNVICVAGSASGLRYLERVAGAINRGGTGSRVSVAASGNAGGLEHFVAGRIDVLVWSGDATDVMRRRLAAAFPGSGPQPSTQPFGRFAVGVVINKANPLKAVTIDQFRKMFVGEVSQWQEIEAGLLPGQQIKAYCQPLESNSNYIVWKRGMGCKAFGTQVECTTGAADVLRKVASNPAGIGFLLISDGMGIGETKLLGIRTTPGAAGAVPTVTSVFDGTYPLIDELTLYLPPAPSPTAVDFCKCACGKLGGAMTHELTLFHVYEQKKIEAARRLKELKDKAGDAARVLISAPKESAGLLEELNVEYVTDACLVMVNHTVVSQTAAIGGLIAPPTEGGFVRTELAMVEAPLSAETVKVHGQRLKEVNPQQLAVGARGTVIIVHSLNKLDSLTLDQVKAIFGKKLDDWRLLEASQSNLPIRRYGPSKFDLAANIFYDKVLPWAQCTSVDRKDTPVEVIAAVGADTQGIGFVSITDAMDYFRKLEEQAGASTSMAAGGSIVPAAMVDKPGASGDLAGKPSIKILAIGPKGSAIVPDRKTVNDGSYPLSSPLTLYVSPKARETAKNFADFFVTRDVHSILLKYGIVPSFTADERERQSVLAKRQADEEAKLAAERARWESMFTETKLADDFHADVGQWDDTCGFARADLGDGKFAFQAQPAKAAQNAMNRQGLPAGFQLDMNVQIKFGAPGNQNGLTVHFLSKPSTAGGQLNWGTGYSLLIVDDVANKGLRLFRPELDDKKRVVKPAVQLGQKVTMVDGKTHRLRIISEGDGKIHVFWDDMARPVISLDEGGKFQGADGTSLGLTVAPGVGATVSNVTVKSKKASP